MTENLLDNSLEKKDRVVDVSGPRFYENRFNAIDSLVFRTMTAADIPALKHLQDILFPVKYNDAFYLELLEQSSVTVLAFHKEQDCTLPKLVGVATGRLTVVMSGCRRHVEGYIPTLGVSPEFRRKGLGRYLLAFICKLLKEEFKCELIELHVKADNHAAIALYKNHGFVVAEFLSNHYYFNNAHHDAFRLIQYSQAQAQFCVIL